jgi:hypothetical protein
VGSFREWRVKKIKFPASLEIIWEGLFSGYSRFPEVGFECASRLIYLCGLRDCAKFTKLANTRLDAMKPNIPDVRQLPHRKNLAILSPTFSMTPENGVR